MGDYQERMRGALSGLTKSFELRDGEESSVTVLPDEALRRLVSAAFVRADGSELGEIAVAVAVAGMARKEGWRIRWALPGSEERRLLVLAATHVFVDVSTGEAITKERAADLVEQEVLPCMSGVGDWEGSYLSLLEHAIDSMPEWVSASDVRSLVPEDGDATAFVCGVSPEMRRAFGED